MFFHIIIEMGSTDTNCGNVSEIRQSESQILESTNTILLHEQTILKTVKINHITTRLI